jgi:hypothetical protein
MYCGKKHEVGGESYERVILKVVCLQKRWIGGIE